MIVIIVIMYLNSVTYYYFKANYGPFCFEE